MRIRPLDGEPLAANVNLLRLPKPPPDFVPNEWQPDWSILNPSTGDKEHARLHKKPVRVSVWDDARTTIEQARGFRAGPTIVLRFSVQVILDVASATGCSMHVVYDPLEPPHDEQPGADGHAGIEGLERGPEENKPKWKERLSTITQSMCIIAH